MKKIALALILFSSIAALTLASPFSDFSVFGYNPVASPGAIVPGSGSTARFTVLSDYVIRMEYSHSGVFEDRATLTFLNRKLPVPSYTSHVNNGILTIRTNQLTLTYQIGQIFADWTLSVSTNSGVTWKYGMVDYGNLLGTVKSLDELCTVTLNCTQNADVRVHSESLHCGWGVVSRGGWTTIDDTSNYIMSAEPGSWFGSNLTNTDDMDVYFFGHGSNYRAALQDYTNLAGKTPMFHRSLLGAWFTRWYDYDNSDVERLVNIFKQDSVPLDVLVLDMNWHTKNDWTGYSWDRQLFPYPNDTIAFIHSQGLLTAANLHDADGIGYWEDKYADMCSVMGQNPGAKQTVMFSPMNATYMHALEDIVLANANFDFYWIDWQQGGNSGGCPGNQLNPTFITDHVRSTDSIRRGESKRDMVLARWGGLGGHRYPVGFSGDVSTLSWECFSFQPYFSVTAANVAYGYISHDLVGPETDHELHVRWMQFGSFSGILRIHDRGMSAGSCWPNCPIVNIWRLPEKYFDAIREAMQARVALLPYMYTEMRNGYDTGVPMVYPMYYDWPNEDDAYNMGPGGVHAQYMFGPNLLVAPVCTQGDSNEVATKTIWLPPATWYDDVFGLLVEGGSSITRQYDVSEIPMFVRAGAIVPRIPNPAQVGVASQQFTALDIYIYPGNTSATYNLYEDDLSTLGYLQGKSATQLFSYSRTLSSVQVVVGAMVGSFQGAVANRHLRFFFVGTMPIASGSVDSSPLSYARWTTAQTFSYDGKTGTAIVDAGVLSTSSSHTISITLAAEQNDSPLAKLKGYASRAQLAKRTMDNVRETPYSTSVGPGMVKQSASRAVELSLLAGDNVSGFLAKIGGDYNQLVSVALTELGGNPNPAPPAPTQTALVQMWSESRGDMLLCGTAECMSVNGDYQIMWTEGYQPPTPTGNTIPLNDFYSTQYSDNWADVLTTPPDGYSAAIFSNGQVMSSNGGEGMECLQLWVSPSTNDHMTLASPGLPWAQQHAYVQRQTCIGAYVYTSPEGYTKHMEKQQKLRDAATSYAEELLQSVLAVN